MPRKLPSSNTEASAPPAPRASLPPPSMRARDYADSWLPPKLNQEERYHEPVRSAEDKRRIFKESLHNSERERANVRKRLKRGKISQLEADWLLYPEPMLPTGRTTSRLEASMEFARLQDRLKDYLKADAGHPPELRMSADEKQDLEIIVCKLTRMEYRNVEPVRNNDGDDLLGFERGENPLFPWIALKAMCQTEPTQKWAEAVIWLLWRWQWIKPDVALLALDATQKRELGALAFHLWHVLPLVTFDTKLQAIRGELKEAEKDRLLHTLRLRGDTYETIAALFRNAGIEISANAWEQRALRLQKARVEALAGGTHRSRQ